MKKTAVLLCGIFIFTSLSFASADGAADNAAKEKSAKTVSMKKTKEIYHQELETLINKHKDSSEEEKILIKDEIKKLIAQYTEKDLSYKKEKLEKYRIKTQKLEKEIAAMENDKEAFINKKTDFYLSDEGQKKLRKINEKKEAPVKKANMKKINK